MLPTADTAAGGRLFTTTPRWLVVQAGGTTCGLPVGLAREIVPARRLTRLPGALSETAGLLNLRGRVVTVFDLARVLGGASAAGGQVVVLEAGGRAAGLLVDAVLSVAVEPLARGARGPLHALGTTSWDGGDIPVLDPERLLADLLG